MTGGQIDMRGVDFAYGDTAFEFDLHVKSGDTLAILGPSGSGKSTLLLLLAGFEKPREGRIEIGGTDITTLPPQDRPFSMIFQDHNLFPHLDIATNVALGLPNEADPAKRVEQALIEVGLGSYGPRKPGDLSGGERQRVALARCMLRDKPVLLLDEPLTALGPAMRAEMLAALKKLRDERGVTIVMVTHNPGDARALANRTAFLHAGRIAMEGPTDAILAHPDLAAYLGPSP